MKKTLIIAFSLSSLLLIINSFDIGHALMMFYLAGIVPGTNIAIDAARMLEIFALLSGFIVARIMSSMFRVLKHLLPTIGLQSQV
jgi:hypothetical protein